LQLLHPQREHPDEPARRQFRRSSCEERQLRLLGEVLRAQAAAGDTAPPLQGDPKQEEVGENPETGGGAAQGKPVDSRFSSFATPVLQCEILRPRWKLLRPPPFGNALHREVARDL